MMRKFLIATCAALSLVACAQPSTSPDGVPAPSLTLYLSIEKGLLYAESAKLGADATAAAAVDSGLLKPGSPDAIRIADALQAAQNALVLARAAQNVGRLDTVQAQVSLATTLIGSALVLIPQKNSTSKLEAK